MGPLFFAPALKDIRQRGDLRVADMGDQVAQARHLRRVFGGFAILREHGQARHDAGDRVELVVVDIPKVRNEPANKSADKKTNTHNSRNVHATDLYGNGYQAAGR